MHIYGYYIEFRNRSLEKALHSNSMSTLTLIACNVEDAMTELKRVHPDVQDGDVSSVSRNIIVASVSKRAIKTVLDKKHGKLG